MTTIAEPLTPSLIRKLYPHAYRTVGGADVSMQTIRTLQGLASKIGTTWSAGPVLRSLRPIPSPALAAADLMEDEE